MTSNRPTSKNIAHGLKFRLLVSKTQATLINMSARENMDAEKRLLADQVLRAIHNLGLRTPAHIARYTGFDFRRGDLHRLRSGHLNDISIKTLLVWAKSLDCTVIIDVVPPAKRPCAMASAA